MAKTVPFLALLGFAAAVQGKYPSVDYLGEIRTKCLSETNFDGTILDKAISRQTIPDLTDDYARYMICSYKKQGYLDEEGELKYDAIENFLSDFYERDSIKPIIKTCREEQKGETTGQKTHSFAKCVIEKLRELD